ncbi:FtsL-like putative cell division protein [uncultured Fibrella sp.]|uniref:FtsL-like putative cell division protein n=1 Tax=uncultured Fibrella sp. TaxID=1284596 RepID=UPI0035CAD4F8
MALNTLKHQPPVKPLRRKRKPNRLAVWINEVMGFDRLFGSDNAWPIRNINRILWVTLLLVVYIGLNHNAERLVRRIHRTRTDVDELRSQATTLEADLARSSKQSELSKRVLADSLLDSQSPPTKLIVND